MLSTKRPASDERSSVQTSCVSQQRLPAFGAAMQVAHRLVAGRPVMYHQFMTPQTSAALFLQIGIKWDHRQESGCYADRARACTCSPYVQVTVFCKHGIPHLSLCC
jgi:hypothetical protein